MQLDLMDEDGNVYSTTEVDDEFYAALVVIAARRNKTVEEVLQEELTKAAERVIDHRDHLE